eukprot:2159096-Amphidinium_carterae.1
MPWCVGEHSVRTCGLKFKLLARRTVGDTTLDLCRSCPVAFMPGRATLMQFQEIRTHHCGTNMLSN